MAIYNSDVERCTKSDSSNHLTIRLGDKINVLIFIHVLAFVLYRIFGWNGLLERSLAGMTVGDYIDHFLVISSKAEDIGAQWSISLFTYQFIHFNLGELLLSVTMLWIFGNILRKRFSQREIVAIYFLFATISALVFNISHLIFPVFSGPRGVMEGAFGGVLGIMSTTVFFYGKHPIRIIGNHIRFQLWQLFVASILLSFIFVYKNNIAYILVYICSIFAGFRFAEKKAVIHSV